MSAANPDKITIQREKYKCPCCGYYTLDDFYDSYDVCPVCFWEDDGLQFGNPLVWGGANYESLIQARINYRAFGAMDERFINDVRKPEESELSGIDYVHPRCWYDPGKDLLYIRKYYVSQDGKLFSRMEILDWRFGSELTKWGEKEKVPNHNLPVPYAGCVRLDFREAMRKLSTYKLKHAVFTELTSRELSYIHDIFGLTLEQMQRMSDDEAGEFWYKLNEMADSKEPLREIAEIIRERISGWAMPHWDIPDWMAEW